MVAHNSATTDYGATTSQRPANKLHRPLTLANHVLHWISSLIVMSIAAYLISKYRHNVHMRYWVALVSFPCEALQALLSPSFPNRAQFPKSCILASRLYFRHISADIRS
jgi:hypothetical protein